MELGATGEAVAHNVKRLRESANLTYTEVSKLLAARNRSISPLAVRRIEEMERRVDVDDLVALAVILDVSPVSLLYPGAVEGKSEVQATGLNAPVSAEVLWEWMRAEAPLRGAAHQMETFNFLGRAMPEWRRQEYSEQLRGWAEAAAKRGSGRGAGEAQDLITALRDELQPGSSKDAT